MYRRQFVIRLRILPALRSVSEVFLNYTKKERYVEHFYHISETKHREKLYTCDCEEGYYIWNLFTSQRGNASHRVIIIAAVCSKCKHSEQVDICWPVSANSLKHVYVCGKITHWQRMECGFDVLCLLPFCTYKLIPNNHTMCTASNTWNIWYISHFKEETASVRSEDLLFTAQEAYTDSAIKKRR